MKRMEQVQLAVRNATLILNPTSGVLAYHGASLARANRRAAALPVAGLAASLAIPERTQGVAPSSWLFLYAGMLDPGVGRRSMEYSRQFCTCLWRREDGRWRS